MEAGEYGLTRGTCFIARRLEVVAVAGLLSMLSCVLGAAGFFRFFSFRFFFFERTRPASSTRLPCLDYLSTNMTPAPNKALFVYPGVYHLRRSIFQVPGLYVEMFFFAVYNGLG